MVAYLEKSDGSEGFHQIVNFINASHIRYALTENLTIYVSLINQFWETATARTLDNEEIQITATIDWKVKIVTKASARRHLKLADSNDEAASTGVDVKHRGAATTITLLDAGQGSELMVFCTTLSKKLESLEKDLKQTKQIYGAAYTKLIKKVKNLKKTVKSSQDRRREKIIVSNDEDYLEDSSKQGMKIAAIDQDLAISSVQHDAQTQRRYGQDMEYDTSVFDTTAVYIRRSEAKAKYKGKGIMEEFESPMIKTKRIKRQQEQDRLGLEAVVKLQDELDEKERQRIDRVHKAARSFTKQEWEDIRARVKADE
nr:hypothetical protein [Tanacetum cinerariifolium]